MQFSHDDDLLRMDVLAAQKALDVARDLLTSDHVTHAEATLIFNGAPAVRDGLRRFSDVVVHGSAARRNKVAARTNEESRAYSQIDGRDWQRETVITTDGRSPRVKTAT